MTRTRHNLYLITKLVRFSIKGNVGNVLIILILLIFIISGDVDDVFLPSPSDLLANLSNCREQVVSMLTGDFPNIFTLIVAISQSSINKDKSTPSMFDQLQTYPSFSTAARRRKTASVPLFKLLIKW